MAKFVDQKVIVAIVDQKVIVDLMLDDVRMVNNVDQWTHVQMHVRRKDVLAVLVDLVAPQAVQPR
jgi:hypothetical protein